MLAQALRPCANRERRLRKWSNYQQACVFTNTLIPITRTGPEGLRQGVIREVNGIELLTTEIETITDRSSNEDSQTSFIPAGMINISAGLSNRLSNQLQLEIAPFYKYPLRDWPGEDARFGIVGLDLRLLFQKKTRR